jgi:membrane associated rhomboid family serine protease
MKYANKKYMSMFRDRRVNRKWRRIFRTVYAVIGISLIIGFLPFNEEVEIFFASAGATAGLIGMVFLWFLYNMPEKLKMQEEEIDIFNNN